MNWPDELHIEHQRHFHFVRLFETHFLDVHRQHKQVLSCKFINYLEKYKIRKGIHYKHQGLLTVSIIQAWNTEISTLLSTDNKMLQFR
jgi:hypothetical protein